MLSIEEIKVLKLKLFEQLEADDIQTWSTAAHHLVNLASRTSPDSAERIAASMDRYANAMEKAVEKEEEEKDGK